MSPNAFVMAPKLLLSIPEMVYYIYPTTSQQDSNDSEGERVTNVVVSVTLQMPIASYLPNKISSLYVQARASESLHFSRKPTEQNELVYDTRQLQGTSQKPVESGASYSWDAALEIKCHATPYERLRYGRVYQNITATLKWDDTDKDGGYDDIEVQQRIWITCIPHPSNLLDYSKSLQAVIEGLGPMNIQVISPHLTVGGHLRMILDLPSPVPTCRIRLLHVHLVQMTTLQSRLDTLYKEECTPERVKILEVPEIEFTKADVTMQGGGWHVHRLMRVASEDYLRPSTLQASQANIRINHMLDVTIKFQHDGKQHQGKRSIMTYNAQWPIVISSCACRWGSMKLPMYSKEEPSHIVPSDTMAGGASLQTEAGQPNNPNCACKMSLEDLLQIEEEIKEGHPWLTPLENTSERRLSVSSTSQRQTKEQQLYRPSA